MKLQMSWGWKIALLYSGFVVMMLVLVGMSVSEKIDLVSDDYYAMELVHQQKIDKIKRSKALEEPVKWAVNERYLEVTFPANLKAGDVGGRIILYCPSDDRKDASFPISLDADGTQKIAREEISPGRYHLQLDWASGDLSYWDEGVITIAK